MKAAVIIPILLLALLSFVAIIVLAGLWLNGGKIVFIPGLQIVIATPLLILVLASIEIVMLVFAFLIWRTSW